MSKILTNRAGNIKLELRDDRLSAWLTLRSEKRLTDEQDILDLIEEAGIRTGFEEAEKYMRKHGLEKDFDTPFPIAMCNRVKGESKLNYFFDLEFAKHFDGRVTPCDLDTLTCIEAGTVIADYNSNIFERQGSIYDIYGEMLSDEKFDLETAQRVAGDNVSFKGDKNQFVATDKGFISVDEAGRISVIGTLILEGDLCDPGQELRCPADLEIRGSLQNAVLYAAGKVLVKGDIINVTLNCRSDLNLDGEIIECRQPGLDVAGNISCRGIQASRVLCRGQIAFTHQISGSEIIADSGISSETGSIRAGHIECGNSLTVAELGDPDGTETMVEITIGPYHKAILMRLTRELLRLKEAPEDNAAAIEEMNGLIKTCEADLDGELNRFLNRPREQKYSLKVLRELHPPVQARILKHEYKIRDRQSGLELWEKD